MNDPRHKPPNAAEVEAVLARVRRSFGASVASRSAAGDAESAGPGVFGSVDAAVAAAQRSFERFRDVGLDARFEIIDNVRRAMREVARELAQAARDETGLGRAEDKYLKNLLVIDKTPGPEDLEPTAKTGDHGMTVTEFAPFGILAAITPTTNPTATIINNTLSAVSAGNGIVFNVHPGARQVSVDTIGRINRAIRAAGGPATLVTAIDPPTIESAQELMRHPGVRVLVVTGGPYVVEEALKTRKRAITAGPGNPPVLVDGTANLALAGREIVRGSSFDNNMVCTDEKEVFVVQEQADELLRAMARSDAVVLNGYQLKQIEKVIFERLGKPGKPGKIRRRWIGQNAGDILREIGVPAGDEVRLAVAEVPIEHSLVWTEQMMPVLPVARVRNVDEGIDLAERAEHGFRHTASIYSNDVATITRMAKVMNVSIFVANAANFAGLGQGGEDFTSFSIATPTGEGLTRPRTFSRIRRLTIAGSLRIV